MGKCLGHYKLSSTIWASLVAQTVRNLPVSRRPGFDSWVGKIPWRREWLPAPYSGLENSRDRGAWRATVSPLGLKESGTTQLLSQLLILPLEAVFPTWLLFCQYVILLVEKQQVQEEDGDKKAEMIQLIE